MLTFTDLFPSRYQPIYVLMVGLPASGKTFLANRFLAKWERYSHVRIVHIGSDMHIEKYAQQKNATYDDVFSETIARATAIFWKEHTQALARGESIIVDRTSVTEEARHALISVVPDHYIKIAVEVAIDEVVRQRRLSERVGKTIIKEHADRMWDTYTSPTTDEGFDMVLSAEEVHRLVL